MAVATRAQALTSIANRIKLWDILDRFANDNSDNWLALEETLLLSLKGDDAQQIIDSFRRDRSNISAILSPSNIRSALTPHMVEFVRAIDRPHGGLLSDMIEFRDNLVENSDTVNSRDLTYGAMTAGGSNVGDGQIYYHAFDKHGSALEGGHVETLTFECVQDQNAAPDGEQAEVFEVRGNSAETDFLKVDGSGIRGTLRVVNAKDSETFLTNPSFSTFTGTQPTTGTPTVLGATDELTGWVVDTPANFEIQLDETFRTFPGETNAYALRFKDNGLITQTVQEQRKPKFVDDVPYMVKVAVRRENLCDGTLTLRIGSSSRAFTVTTLTNSAWANDIFLVSAGDLYYENFTEQDLTVEVELSGRTVGEIVIDDVIVAPMTLIDGRYFSILGAGTPFLKKDVFTCAGSYNAAQPANRGIWQYWLTHRSGISAQLGFGYTLPSNNAGGETIPDP